MYSKTNKVLSIAMSAAILLTNIMTPMKVYADEVNEPAQDLESEMPLETEPVSYYLTLPYYEEVSYSVDKNHMETKDSQDKDIRLAYHEEEKVEFSFQTADTVQVMEIHLKDNEKQEVPFSIDENRKVSLAMPAKDLDLTLVLEDIPAPAPAPDTEQPVATGSTMENPVSQDEGINEFDLTAQEVSGDQYLYPSDDGTQDSDQNGQADENPADNEDQETGSDQQPGGAGDEADLQEGEDAPLNGSEEGSGDTAGESNPETPGIVLTAETEADGLPSQGSILTVDTLTIPLMNVDFNPKTDFTHISFNSEKDQVELVSDEVDITTPGTYSTIYRVTHDNGAKMWYVLRPVQVSENTGVREPETESIKDSHGSSEDETEEAEEEPDDPLLAESITEAGTEMEESMIVSESETPADETEEVLSVETEDEEKTEEALEEMTETITEELTEASEETPAAGPYKVSAFADDIRDLLAGIAVQVHEKYQPYRHRLIFIDNEVPVLVPVIS